MWHFISCNDFALKSTMSILSFGSSLVYFYIILDSISLYLPISDVHKLNKVGFYSPPPQAEVCNWESWACFLVTDDNLNIYYFSVFATDL